MVRAARAARRRAVAPFSGFKVGAALRTTDGEVYTGCNVENATFGLSICAERVALLKALSEGARKFVEVVVVTAAGRPTPPCGACRQLLWEFCGDVVVHMVTSRGQTKTTTLGELLPYAFDKRAL